jgi:hypothetical protein
VRGDEPAGVDADQTATEHIVAEQDLALAAFEMREVEILPRELDAARLHGRNPVARNEQLASGDATDKTGDRGVAALGESCDDIVHPAEAASSSIDERAVEDTGECQPDRFGGWLPGV